MRWGWLGVLLLVGCATTAPVTPPTVQEARGLETAQRMLKAVEQAYGRAPELRVIPKTETDTLGSYREGVISLVPAALRYPFMEALLAHEVGHYLLNHRLERGVQPELDANAKGIEVLTRIHWYGERAAFYLMLNFVRRGRARVGHPDGCMEVRDLVQRFPQYEVEASC